MDLIATGARLPKRGETIVGDRFSSAPGGKGANQALAARRAGAAVRMVGAVGADEFAAPATELLRKSGMDLSLVRRADMRTGIAMIVVDAAGENMITIVAGANGCLTVDDAYRAIDGMTSADTLLLQMEVPEDTLTAAVIEGRKKGVTSILNVAPFIPSAPALARAADIVVANETEFEQLTGSGALAAAERQAALMRLHSATGHTIIVTLGPGGAIAARGGQLLKVAALDIAPLDTVGAGDTFCGYLAASLDAGLPLEASLRRAAVAGSLACLERGAQSSIPTAEAVDALLQPPRAAQ